MTLHILMTSYVPEGEGVDHPRAQYAMRTADSLASHLYPLEEPISFLLANDGPIDQPHVDLVRSVLVGRLGHAGRWDFHVSGGPRLGIGGSLNRALAYVGGDDLWMYTTDDWMLIDDYDLTKAVRLIREHNYDYVRLGPPHPDIWMQTRFEQGMGFWLDIHPDKGGYAFATRPFIANKRLWTTIGPFRERCDAYVAERDYSDRVMYDSGLVSLAEVVNGSLEGPWEHIGEYEVGNKYP